ncbi:MAG: alpha/beta fold hydrolase [Kineosporiaceae bacterium]
MTAPAGALDGAGLLPGFTPSVVDVPGASIATWVAGSGPPVLALHGYPQTHVMWHRVAPELVRHHTVVLADLRGYGDSTGPPADPDGLGYSKRAMAADQAAVMTHLGFDRFAVVGHDRGARVGHRLARDHPDRVTRLAVLDIVPTVHAYAHVDRDFAENYYHCFFLSQRTGVPEALLAAAPEEWVRLRMQSRHAGPVPFDERALQEYVRCFGSPAVVAASCADYRAAAGIDLVHDAQDPSPLRCPVLALWGERGFVGRAYDVAAVWRAAAADVAGEGLPCGHYVAEEAPEQTLSALLPFLAGRRR